MSKRIENLRTIPRFPPSPFKSPFPSVVKRKRLLQYKGYLTPEQLTSIMKHAELGLTGPELQLVIAEADDNADGSIDVRGRKKSNLNARLASSSSNNCCMEYSTEIIIVIIIR